MVIKPKRKKKNVIPITEFATSNKEQQATMLRQVEFALRFNEGNVTLAAEQLGVFPSTVRKLTRQYSYLNQILVDAREGMVDLCESQLRKLIKEGDKEAIKIGLKHKASRSRGYGEDKKGVQLDFPSDGKGPISIRVIDD